MRTGLKWFGGLLMALILASEAMGQSLVCTGLNAASDREMEKERLRLQGAWIPTSGGKRYGDESRKRGITFNWESGYLDEPMYILRSAYSQEPIASIPSKLAVNDYLISEKILVNGEEPYRLIEYRLPGENYRCLHVYYRFEDGQLKVIKPILTNGDFEWERDPYEIIYGSFPVMKLDRLTR